MKPLRVLETIEHPDGSFEYVWDEEALKEAEEMQSNCQGVLMKKQKKQKNDGDSQHAARSPGKKKQSNIKQMTIRYDAAQEKDMQQMAQAMGEKTMSKAFLKAPAVMREQHRELQELHLKMQQMDEELAEAREIIESWQELQQRIAAFKR